MKPTELNTPAAPAVVSADFDESAGTECSHCGLPVPLALVDTTASLQFCCGGCRTVYHVLRDQGLLRYYDERDKVEASGVAANVTHNSFAELDGEQFQRLYCRGGPGAPLTVELYLEGVHCSACVWLVEKLPSILPGVLEVRLQLSRRLLRLMFDPKTVLLSEVARRLDSLGYTPHAFAGVDAREVSRREDRAMLIRMAVAAVVAGNVMMLAFALYAGLFSGIEAEFRRLFRWTSLILAVPAVFWSGATFLRGGWAALRTRTPHTDLPVSIGILVGFVSGAVNIWRDSGEIYFDSVTALIFLLLVGRWLQRRELGAAAASAELLYALTPAFAHVLEAEGRDVAAEVGVDAVAAWDLPGKDVPLQSVRPGDLLRVRAGEQIPADGEVVVGSSHIDSSLLSGESRPQPVAVSEPVFAGTLNVGGALIVRAKQTGEQTRVGRVMKLVQEASARRAPVVLLADRIAGYFVGIVLVLAAITAAVWIRIDADLAVDNAVALLIVTCPCALALATPLAVTSTIGRAARRGFLIKGGDALERLNHVQRIIFDKTGTLTRAKMQVVHWEGDATLRAPVAALERRCNHPVAAALAAADGQKEPHRRETPELVEEENWLQPAPLAVCDVHYVPGFGIRGTVAGVALVVGSRAWLSRCGIEMPESWLRHVSAVAPASALTPVWIARDGEVAAWAALGDPLRPDAAPAVAKLREQGLHVSILSGDDTEVVRSVGAQLGLPPERAIGNASPEAKVAAVETALRSVHDDGSPRGGVLMVGDGVNDAAALSAASVGVAVHGGAETSLAGADVFVTVEGVAPILELLAGARRAAAVVRRNILFSLSYNVVGIGLAMSGTIGPLWAAVLMPLSSLTVVASSYRARTFP